jgi:cob(I)alamin adenosyltransferase
MSSASLTATLSSLSTVLQDCEQRLSQLINEDTTKESQELVAALHEAERFTRAAEREIRRAEKHITRNP